MRYDNVIEVMMKALIAGIIIFVYLRLIPL